jgi:hypothetical protein
LEYAATSVAFSSISIGLPNSNAEQKTFTFPNGVAIETQEFAICVYAGDSAQPLDIFFDNLRCRGVRDAGDAS